MGDDPKSCSECYNFERWWTGYEYLFVCTLQNVILGGEDDLEELESTIVGGNITNRIRNIEVCSQCPFKL